MATVGVKGLTAHQHKPFMSVYAGKFGQKTNQKQTLLKLNITQKKQTTQNAAKQN